MARNFIAITQYHEPGTARTRAATGNWYICTGTSRKPSDSLERATDAPLLMNFRIRAVSDLLEPCEAKVSSTVLRGAGGGDTLCLPGHFCLFWIAPWGPSPRLPPPYTGTVALPQP